MKGLGKPDLTSTLLNAFSFSPMKSVFGTFENFVLAINYIRINYSCN